MSRLFLISVAWLTISSSIRASETKSLQLQPQRGSAPLKVSIRGPPLILERIAKCKQVAGGWFGRTNNGLLIDWGDGSDYLFGAERGSNCSALQRTHEYSVPGTYDIQVKAWHPGPTDGPETDWSGSAQVTVTGNRPSASLEILEPTGAEVYKYEQFPELKYHITVGKKVMLRTELLAEGDKSIATVEKEISAVGKGALRMRPNQLDDYLDALRTGKTKFYLRVGLYDKGTALVSKKSPQFTMTAEIIRPHTHLRVIPNRGADPLKVEARYHAENPNCFSYELDWGDGSKSEVQEKYCKRQRSLHFSEITFQHRYSKAGIYSIKLRPASFGRTLTQSVAFEITEINLLPEPGVETAADADGVRAIRAKGCRIENLKLPRDTIVLAATSYKGAPTGKQIDQSGLEAMIFDVTVKSKRPVALFLSNYGPSIWRIKWEANTKIVAALATGYRRQVVAGLPRSTPVFAPGELSRNPCGAVSLRNEFPKANLISAAVFTRPIDKVLKAKEGLVQLGEDLEPDDEMESSGDVTVNSFFDPNAPVAGPAGLADLVKKGVLREVTEEDYSRIREVFHDKLNDQKFREYHGQGYVILKKMTFPNGLHGAHSAKFLLEKGVPMPHGDLGHGLLFDLNNGSCVGHGC